MSPIKQTSYKISPALVKYLSLGLILVIFTCLLGTLIDFWSNSNKSEELGIGIS